LAGSGRVLNDILFPGIPWRVKGEIHNLGGVYGRKKVEEKS
jgi:hypothetical protein